MITTTTIALEVVDFSTDEVASRISVEGKSERQIEKVLLGIMRNMNIEKFFVREVPA